MLSQEVKGMIPKIQHFLATQPIDKAWLFGSCSRGEEKPDSDVDILVEYDRKGAAISLMRISGIMVSLEDIIGAWTWWRKEGCSPSPRNQPTTTKYSSMRPALKPQIEAILKNI